MEPLTATYRDLGERRCTIALAGELDLASASVVTTALGEVSVSQGCEVAFDLSELSFADSAGISSLIKASIRVRAAGGEFSVTGCHDEVRRVLELSGLIDYLNVQ